MLYKLLQNKNYKSSAFEKWYAKPVWMHTVTTEEVCDLIQRNCTVKRSDVRAVIEELVEVIHDGVCRGDRVVLDGLGTFKCGINSKGAEKPEEFDGTYIKDFHVLFYPTTTVEKNGNRVRSLLKGCTAKQIPQYSLPEPEDEGGDEPNP